MLQQTPQEQHTMTRLLDIPVECLAVLPSGIWVGTCEGLWQLNPPSTVAIRYAERATITDIAPASTALWFITNTGEGLGSVRLGGGRAQWVGTPTNDRRTAQMHALAVWRGDVVVATEGGLFRYNPSRRRWEEPITQERYEYLTTSPLRLWAVGGGKLVAYDERFQIVDTLPVAPSSRPLYENMRLQWVVPEGNQLTLYSYATTAKSLHRHPFRFTSPVELRSPLRTTSLLFHRGQRWVGLSEERARPLAPVRGAFVRLDTTYHHALVEWVGAGLRGLGVWRGEFVLGTSEGLFSFARKVKPD